MENNKATVIGRIVQNPTFSHEVRGEKFHIFQLESERKSGTFDIVPILVSEHLMDAKKEYIGRFVRIDGRYKSFNKHEAGHTRLVLSVFADDVQMLEEERFLDEVYLDGYICKKATLRKTPYGRQISDLLVAVNRSYGKSDYIPCICWGRNAQFASNFEVGTHVRIWGRIQSREYQKQTHEMIYEIKVAYKISVSAIEVVQ